MHTDLRLGSRTRGNNNIASLVLPLPEDEELDLVLRAVADVFGARGAILTAQGDEEADRIEILHCDRAAGFDPDFLRRLVGERAFAYDETDHDRHQWNRVKIDGGTIEVLVMPIRRIPGHRRIVVSAVFSALEDETRAAAEEVHRRRTPISSGYFRLWQINRISHQREIALEGALNAIKVGLFMLDADCHVLFANRAALHSLEAGDGLKMQGRTVRATNFIDKVRLRTAFELAIAPDSEISAERRAPMLSIERQSGAPLILLALPQEHLVDEPDAVAAIVFLVDPAIDITGMLEPLCRLYRLSKSETRLACLLTTGITVATAAERMMIKEQTARSLLKQIFIKTGTSRQSELILSMLSSVVRVDHPMYVEPV